MNRKTTPDTLVSPLLVYLVAVFVSTLVISNVLSNHMIDLFGITLDAGTLTFPITYIISDVLSEVYGYKWTRRSAWIAAAMNALFALFIIISCECAQPEWYDGSVFETALRGSTRIVIASIVSFTLGDWANDIVFEKMKQRAVGSKGFSFRAVTSSFAGSIVDTTAFVLIAFLGTMPANEMLPMIITSVLIKTGYEAIALPATVFVTKKVQDSEDSYLRVRV